MFFSWYLKNKNFKQRGNLRGQIAPFLLVTLVILLVAAITTINIGRVGIDKTYSANAADSGALAGASMMAGMMNGLCETNQALLDSYVGFYLSYMGTFILAYDNWEAAWIAMAEVTALQLAAIALAYFYELQGTISCYEGFAMSIEYGIVIGFLASEVYLIHWEALPHLYQLANVDVPMLKQIIEDYHDESWENYCNLRESINENVSDGELSAKKIAFGNSGIAEKLSTSQGDDFSAFLSGDSPGGGSYSWSDKIPQTHTVTVDVNMPSITTYDIQHTVLSYSQEIDILDQVISDLNDVTETLYGMAIAIDTIAASYVILAALGLVIGGLWTCCDTCTVPVVVAAACAAWVIACAIWYPSAVIAGGFLTWIGGILSFIMLLEGALGTGTLYGVMDGLEQAFAGLDPDGSVSSTSCGDAEDLLIVMFSAVPYPGDVRARSTQNHPGVSSGLVPTTYPSVTSSAVASYSGGDVGSFDASYDSRLTSAN